MSSYIRSIERQKYPRRDELNNYPKRLEKRRTDNAKFNVHNNPKDNSAILKRVINKRYKENIKKKYPYKNLDINVTDNDDNYNNNYNNTYDNNYYNINYKDFRYNNPSNYNNYNNPNYYNYSSSSKYGNSEYNSKYNNYNNNENYNNNNYNDNDIDVNNYKNNLRNRTININNYISPNVNDDDDDSNNNYDDEYYINNNLGMNGIDNRRRNDIMNRDRRYYLPYSRSLGKNTAAQRLLNNRIYNFNTYGDMYDLNPSNNQPFYLVTDNDRMGDYDMPYKKRKGKDYFLQNNNGYYMDNIPGKEINTDKRNNRDNYYNYDDNNKFNRSFIIYNNNDDDYLNNYNERTQRRRNRSQNKNSYYRNAKAVKAAKAYKERTIKFANHLSQYFVTYYMNIIKKLFNFLKSQKNKITNKKVLNNPKYKKKPINKKNLTNIKNKNIKPDNELKSYQKFINKPTNIQTGALKPLSKDNRMPYHKRNIIIDRIKSSNESVSQDKTVKCEMYRNINELNKKYDDIYNRKNRMSCNKNKGGNDLSFTSENRSFCRSVEKYKEIFENNINKERERKKFLENKKKKKDEEDKLRQIEKLKLKEKVKDKNNLEIKKFDNNNLIEELIKKSEELRKNIEKEIQKKKNIKNTNNVNMVENDKNKNNKSNDLEREKIRKKYGKKNSNYNNIKVNDKYEMVDVKKIVTKDRAIHLNIKYLNYIIMNNKNKNNNNKEKWKDYDVCNNCTISLFATKANSGFVTKKRKSDNNGKELTAIQEENKVDLSFSDSD